MARFAGPLILKLASLFFMDALMPLWSASHHPTDFLDGIASSSQQGEEIVAHYCLTCHAEQPMIDMGAPRIGIEKDWGIRLKQGLERLWQHTDEGYHAMPARGGCFECSDEQLKLAIHALVPQLAHKP